MAKAGRTRIDPNTGQVVDAAGRPVSAVTEQDAIRLVMGDAPPVRVQPGAPAGPSPAEQAFEATIAPKRRIQGAFDTEAEALKDARRNAPSDQKWFGTTEVGGKFVTSGDEQAALRALGGSANAGDQLEFIKRAMPQLWSRAAYGPQGPQGGQAPNEALMRALGEQAGAAAAGVAAGDAAQAKAGVLEYEQKVGNPQRDAAAMDRTKLTTDAQMQQAILNAKTSAKLPLLQKQAELVGRDDLTAGQIQAKQDAYTASLADLERTLNGQRGAPPGMIPVQPGGDGGVMVDPGGNRGPQLGRLKQENEASAFLKSIGVNPDGTVGPAGMNLDTLLSEAERNPAVAQSAAVRAAFAKLPEKARSALLNRFQQRAAQVLPLNREGRGRDAQGFNWETFGPVRYGRGQHGDETSLQITTPKGVRSLSYKEPLGNLQRFFGGRATSFLDAPSQQEIAAARRQLGAIAPLLVALEGQ
jgi:hypothetical protein